MLLPALRQLYSNIGWLHLFYDGGHIQAHFVALYLLIPLHNDAILTIHPLGCVTLQAVNNHPRAVRYFTLGNLSLLDFLLRDRRVHEVLLSEFHWNGVVAASLENALVSVCLWMKLQDTHDLPVVVRLILQAQYFHQFAWLEFGLFLGNGIGSFCSEDIGVCIGLLNVAVLLDSTCLLRKGSRIYLALQAVAHEDVVIIAVAIFFHKSPSFFAFVPVRDQPLEDFCIA
mmetsp:Transcript_43897/g.82432  ORF Transcript_43897/g.82432 Transcript_43897/m.82432 type:complete len:228 (-) Transcript_43897:301-984(-)